MKIKPRQPLKRQNTLEKTTNFERLTAFCFWFPVHNFSVYRVIDRLCEADTEAALYSAQALPTHDFPFQNKRNIFQETNTKRIQETEFVLQQVGFAADQLSALMYCTYYKRYSEHAYKYFIFILLLIFY